MSVWAAIPNLLTLLRLGLMPFIGAAIVQGESRLALALVFAAGLTDFADGRLARRYSWATPVGAILDPIADKALMFTVFFTLQSAGAVPRWYFLLVLGRDVFLLAGCAALYWFARVRRFPPSPLGKYSTAFQILYALFTLVLRAFPDLPISAATTSLLWISTGITLSSGIDYAARGRSLARPAR